MDLANVKPANSEQLNAFLKGASDRLDQYKLGRADKARVIDFALTKGAEELAAQEQQSERIEKTASALAAAFGRKRRR